MNERLFNTLCDLEAVLDDKGKSLPPVQSWRPERSGLIDIQIHRDASWWHEGEKISRIELVRLFSSVLRYEEGEYWLVTPVEKLKIQVQDAPFLATGLEILQDESQQQLLVFCTNVGDKVLLGEKNRLHVEFDAKTQEPAPYIHVRNGLNALISRSIYYELAELGQVQQDELFVSSNGISFSLGSILDL